MCVTSRQRLSSDGRRSGCRSILSSMRSSMKVTHTGQAALTVLHHPGNGNISLATLQGQVGIQMGVSIMKPFYCLSENFRARTKSHEGLRSRVEGKGLSLSTTLVMAALVYSTSRWITSLVKPVVWLMVKCLWFQAELFLTSSSSSRST
ncbi:hypothetical protein E2C01_009852 [Portunus trituberculatus]|uniref:Uncharacterized protein n=1 Tax=Portunus trituberculatus TaxID=210409 RepID=A0A5B7D6U1_PORTR|nr:hypothetical protein [Portunus trituberculatus]